MQQTVFNIIFSLLLVLAICQQNNPAPQPYKAPEAPLGFLQPFLPFRPSAQPNSEEEPAPARNTAPETREPSPQPQTREPQQHVPQPTPSQQSPEAPWGSPQPFIHFRPSAQPNPEHQGNNPQPAIVLVPVPQNSNDDSNSDSQGQQQRIMQNAQNIKDQCDQFITPDEATTTLPQTSLHSNTITVTMTVTYGVNGNQQTLVKICGALRSALTQNSGREFNDCVWNRTSPLKRQAGAVWQGSTESPATNATQTPEPSPSDSSTLSPEPDNDNGNGAGSLFTSLMSIILIIGIGFLL
jgi:hypothetical protein